VVGVADGERVGQRVVERDVLAAQVGHRDGGLLRLDPTVVVAVGERRVLAVPAVVDVLDERQPEVLEVRPEREDLVGQVLVLGRGLLPDGLAVAQRHRVRVAEAADPSHRAEVVVERAVLLHQYDDVLDVLHRAGTARCRDRGGARDRRREHRERGAAAGELEEPATIDLGHEVLLRVGS
jgi:hypothetical protein